MALTGNLSNFRIGDILQTLWQNQTWGVLRVQSGGDRRDLVVSPHGVAMLDICSIARARVEERLLHRNVLTKEELTKYRSRELSRRPLADLLREQKKLSHEELAPILEAEAGEQIQALLEWSSGTFEFLEGEPPKELADLEPRDTSSLALEAARRQDERAQMGDRFPTAEERFIINVNHTEGAVGGEASQKILPEFDGKASLRAIADRTVGDFFSTAKLAIELESAGAIRRLTWDELLALGDELGKAHHIDSASRVFDLAETTRTIENTEALFDLAIRRTAAGDNGGAALTLSTAAKQFESDGDFKRSATCLQQAIPLSPRELSVRLQLVEVLKKCEPQPESEIYIALRDTLVVAADRGETSIAELVETDILPRVPEVAEEIERVGRALGQLGRRSSAGMLLSRAARNIKRTKKSAANVISLYRESLQYTPENSETRAALEKLLRTQNSKRLRLLLQVAALSLVGICVAFPIRGYLREHNDESRFEKIRKTLEVSGAGAAIALLEQLESDSVGATTLEKCQALRSEINRKSDERRKVEETDTDEWIRQQFASAADAIDQKDYASAIELYEGILRRRNDDHRTKLVKLRLQIIEGRIRQEVRRVHDLCKSLAKYGKGSIASEPAALKELRSLANSSRLDSLAAASKRVMTKPLSSVLSKPESLRQSIDEDVETLQNSTKEIQIFDSRLANSKDIRELESVLIEARQAESEGNPRVALNRFETLQTRYKGEALKHYITERCGHWTAVVRQLEIVEAAIKKGDTTIVDAEVVNLRRLNPSIQPEKVVAVPIVVHSLPEGARVRIGSEELGTTPLQILNRNIIGMNIEFTMDGFETLRSAIDTIYKRELSVTLNRKPIWNGSINSAPSGHGCTFNDRWYIADRAGIVHAFDTNTRSKIWAKPLETLGGITGSPIVIDEQVWVLTREGKLISLSTADGAIHSTSAFPEGVYSHAPVAARGLAADGPFVHFAVQASDTKLLIAPSSNISKFRTLVLPSRATAGPIAVAGRFVFGLENGSVVSASIEGDIVNIAEMGARVEAAALFDEQNIAISAGERVALLNSTNRSVAANWKVAPGSVHLLQITNREIWYASAGAVWSVAPQPDAKPTIRAELKGSEAVGFLAMSSGVLIAESSSTIAFTDVGGTTPRWKFQGARDLSFVQLSERQVCVVSASGDFAILDLSR